MADDGLLPKSRHDSFVEEIERRDDFVMREVTDVEHALSKNIDENLSQSRHPLSAMSAQAGRMFLSWVDFAHQDPEQAVEGSGGPPCLRVACLSPARDGRQVWIPAFAGKTDEVVFGQTKFVFSEKPRT